MTQVVRAVTYARVSTDGQVERGYSLPEQRERLAAYCRERGYLLLQHIADEGISGRIEERPGLQRLIALADQASVDVVVLVHLWRIGRDNRICENTLYDLRRRGVRIEFVEHASGDSPAEQLMLTMLGGMGQYEWAIIRQRTVAGRVQKARAGKVPQAMGPSGGPYGYRLITVAQAQAIPAYDGRDGELEIVPEEAMIVQQIFARASEGWGVSRLANWLNREQVAARSGTPWETTRVRRMLTNPVYVGRYVHGRRQYHRTGDLLPCGRPRVRVVPRDESECVIVPVPALVTEEVWDTVQAHLAAGARGWPGQPSSHSLLRGLVFCPCRLAANRELRCQNVRKSRNPNSPSYHQRAYICPMPFRGHPACGARYDADELHRLCREEIHRVTRGNWLEREARRRAMERRRAARSGGEGTAAVSELERSLQAVNGRLSQLVDQSLNGVIPADILDQKARELVAQRETIHLALRQARIHHPSLDPDLAGTAAAARAAHLRELLANARTDEDWRTLFALVLTVRLRRGEAPELLLADWVLDG